MYTIPNRLALQTLFENLLGSKNVYFQPPETVNMQYPAIVYKLEDIESMYANDGVYSFQKKYLVTVIDKDPDSPLVDKLIILPTCRFRRQFPSNNLNHYVFTIFY